MPQLFPRYANSLAIAALVAIPMATGVYCWIAAAFSLSSYTTRVSVEIEQPVPFSHEHHAGDLGIDCRYCHTTAEKSRFAGVPPTETCMTCHSQVWKDAPMLKPVRDSYATGKPIEWNRVHDLPGFVYFDHSAHVNAGVSCLDCHGHVDRMPLVSRQQSLHMLWCLDCHRHPESALVPKEKVFEMEQTHAANEATVSKWMQEREIHPQQITNCTACHR